MLARRAWRLCLAVAAFCVVIALPYHRGVAEPAQGEAAQRLHLLVPLPGSSVEMVAQMLIPAGRGPFPLAVISHGSSESAAERREYEVPAFEAISSLLLGRGYAVLLPQRPGHGETGGPYLEGIGNCEGALYEQAGYATADAIAAAIAHAFHQAIIRQDRVLVVGHSAGAWGSLALAASNPTLVKAVINFSGGRGGRSYGVSGRNCAPGRLVQAAAAFGRRARAPTLWLYAANDSFFGPDLSRQMAAAFRAGGGSATYHLLPPMPGDGHYLIYLPDAVRQWAPIVDRFLAALPR